MNTRFLVGCRIEKSHCVAGDKKAHRHIDRHTSTRASRVKVRVKVGVKVRTRVRVRLGYVMMKS